MIIKLIPVLAYDRQFFAKHYVKWTNDAQITEHLYQGSFPVSVGEAHRFYNSLNSCNVVYYIQTDNRIIGIVGLYDIHWPSRVGEFRILIGESNYWDSGIGRDCLERMKKLAFERYNFHKLWLGFNANNLRAKNSYSKSGFKYECTLKEHHYKNNTYNDIIRMYMFQEDYNQWLNSKQG